MDKCMSLGKDCFPGYNLLFITLDSLRYDAAAEALRANLIPGLKSVLPKDGWELRHSPGNFTWSAHQAFFAGFLPTPATPGPHPRLFAAQFEGSETTGPQTLVFPQANIVEGLAAIGYRTICIGGVGFFNKRTELGRALGALFQEDYWQPEFGVVNENSTKFQVDFALNRLAEIPQQQPLFLFVNVSATHQPNRCYVPGAAADSVETQVAACSYADRHLIRLIQAMRLRGPLALIVCSDHGTAYGEDGFQGHRLCHPVVWNVPYAQAALSAYKTEQDWELFTSQPESPFISYSYSYPHKSAYRMLPAARKLAEVWQDEQKTCLSLYFHVPVCNRRCFYCNLFSVPKPDEDFAARYVAALKRQAVAWRDSIDSASFSRFAIGGGTPSCLSMGQLEDLFRIAIDVLGARPDRIPVSVEVSPESVTTEKLKLLKQYGTNRISIGIQSFDAEERKRLGRPASNESIAAAIDCIRQSGIERLNIDLIYGIEGQTKESWRKTVKRALSWNPEEIYLYPLYVRRGTVLGLAPRAWADERNELRQIAWDALLEAGYIQQSMRFFSRPADARVQNPPIPEFRCQDDGMVGLGCGARSYTKSLHYSFEYSPDTKKAMSIIEQYNQRSTDDFRRVFYGFELDDEDQKRRRLILSLLSAEGVNRDDWRGKWGTDPVAEFPEIAVLEMRNLVIVGTQTIRLTPRGLALSDAIGPWLYSAKVKRRMAESAKDSD